MEDEGEPFERGSSIGFLDEEVELRDCRMVGCGALR